MPYKDKQKQNEIQMVRYRRRRFEWLKRNGPCKRCGSVEDLQVDHVDRVTKISHRIWSWTDLRRAEELAKCQVLCWSCHKLKTKTELQGIYKQTHGTTTSYTSYRCRCHECREAHRLYSVKWRAKRALAA